MPVIHCNNGKWRIGDGKCMYETKEKAEKAYKGYLGSKYGSIKKRIANIRKILKEGLIDYSRNDNALKLTENENYILIQSNDPQTIMELSENTNWSTVVPRFAEIQAEKGGIYLISKATGRPIALYDMETRFFYNTKGQRIKATPKVEELFERANII